MANSLLGNRYQVIRPLSSGGFGDTYLAEDQHSPTKQRCVVKKLRPMNEEPQTYQLVKERFDREAVILEDLGKHHPQIPSLHAYFEEDHLFYLVEEWVEGSTLSELVAQQGTQSESSVKEVLSSLLPVLNYVHSKRIVHRDIKPDNIILRVSDRQPVLIDFGAVKETMATVVTASGNSTRSIVVGTPGFMPSEQSIGRPVYASDLYSLGLTAIYLLTGKLPQELPSDPGTGEMSWRQYAPMVSPTLGNVLSKAIQVNYRDRYQNAPEMLAALQSNSGIPTTVVSLPPPPSATVVNAYPATAAPLPVAPSAAISPSQSVFSEWQKMLIIGSIMGIFVVSAVALIQYPGWLQSNENKNGENNQDTQAVELENVPNQATSNPPVVQPMPSPTAINVTPQESLQQTVNPTPPAVNPPINSLGWIRIGAVNNPSGVAPVGTRLIDTRQNVTIEPRQVPSIGDRVKIINNVNFRDNYPQPPLYRLPSQKGILVENRYVVILNISAFVDTTVSSSYTVVWAQVAFAE